MILTRRVINAEEALDFGLVLEVVSRSELMDTVRDIISRSPSEEPLAARLVKRTIQSGLETGQHTDLVIECPAQAVLYGSEDKQEATSAFLEKRRPQFRGR